MLPAYQPPPQIGGRTANGPNASRSSASIARPASGKSSLRLTVKAPPSKLRQATSGASIPPNPYAEASESDTTPAPRAARATRNPRTVVEPDSDEDDEDAPGEAEEDEDEEEEEDDAEGEQDTEMMDNEESEEDADGEDEDMEDEHPPPPVIRQERATGKSKPSVTVIAPSEGPLKSVEDKEMEDEDDDEELSDLESDDILQGQNNDEDEEEDELDSDAEDENSRSATPDLSKLTRRQRGAFEEETVTDGLMSLSNEAQKKKHLTAEEHAMRRAEMARRRKNLSEKRNEEEKMDTINKLLQKPAPKRRTRAEIEAAKAAERSPGAEDEYEKADPLYVRWVNTSKGSYIGVPQEWLDAPIGEQLRKPGGMIQEVA
ncbi:INO80 complex subunit 2 [Lecanosticta acicola]|uniref:INO80 complex subunit 2 n=1 Tax=Lecanosticta acicola TaxID=111012 RepID=A0AAI8YT59_9PEZI|nr:INO80 complex subunit 2 [Lecanosticta acicola]